MAKNVMISFFDVEKSMIVVLISVVIFVSSNKSKISSFRKSFFKIPTSSRSATADYHKEELINAWSDSGQNLVYMAFLPSSHSESSSASSVSLPLCCTLTVQEHRSRQRPMQLVLVHFVVVTEIIRCWRK